MLAAKLKLDEAELKVRCIDYILERNYSENIIIANEFSYADGARRADLVCFSDSMHAYEIKSDFDSLQRLSFQLLEYKACFDYIDIVTTEKHLDGVRKKAPRYAGIILVKHNELIQLRKPQKFKRFNKYLMTTMIDSHEVTEILRRMGIRVKNELNAVERRKLLAQYCTTEQLHKEISSRLKEKHSVRFRTFMANRGDTTLLDDLPLLGNLKLW